MSMEWRTKSHITVRVSSLDEQEAKREQDVKDSVNMTFLGYGLVGILCGMFWYWAYRFIRWVL